MPGPTPKQASTRARRNKSSTGAVLNADHAIVAPELPEGDWHRLTLEWWRDLWASPMAPEYVDVDRHELYKLAMLVDDFWTTTSMKTRQELSAEIRQQRKDFGLTPMGRRSLQWEIERTEEAQDKGQRRRTKAADTTAAPSGGGNDPRAVLRAL